MSSRGGSSSSSNGGGVQSIPAASRRMVQSLKEIVNFPELEIYAMLKECNMDPNEAVNRLLSQDPFHEVKSKREKKKEIKDTFETRSRGASNISNRGGRGSDHYIGRGGSNQFNSSEAGPYGKPAYKKENGPNNIGPLHLASGMPGNNMNRQPSVQSDPITTENKGVTTVVADGVMSSSQPSSGSQSAWSGVPGLVSMADIVKMGRSHGKTSGTANSSQHGISQHHGQAAGSVVSRDSRHDLGPSEDYVPTVSELNLEPGVHMGHHFSPNDDWPLIEQPLCAQATPVSEPPVASEQCMEASNLSSNGTNWSAQSVKEDSLAVEDADVEHINASHAGSASVSSTKILEDDSRGASFFTNQPQRNAFDHQEVEEVGKSVSSVTSNLQQLSLQEDGAAPPEEDNLPVIIPEHLQVQAADCSHLSFGSFGSGISAALSGSLSSRPLRSNMEEVCADTDDPSVGHSETRNPEYCSDEPIKTMSDGNLVHRTGAGAGGYDLPSSSQPEVLKPESAEAQHGNQYRFSSASNFNFENGQQMDAAFPHSQTNSQMQNLAPFSNVMAYTNSIPNSLLAASVQPGRESDIPYSPFPITQSMVTTYVNAVSSISNSTISMSEALKNAGFSSAQPTAQTLCGSNVATGPALPQHLAVHPYSQPTVPLGPFTNLIGYPLLPQSYTYMPSAFQQTFTGNNTFHQSLAAVLPQYKNSVSVSSLPQSASIASGYGGFGSSNSIPSNFSMSPPAAPGATTIGYEDLMSSQFKDNSHLISLQQNENSAMWVHGPGSRTVSAVPSSTYYSFQGQSQQPSGFRQSQQPSQNYGALGYPNFYHSQTGISLEHQQLNPRDGPLGGSQGQASKQSQQIWQNSY
ncbi:hypothetical protein NMG60_11015083 [Bertholletia excelsa]